MKKERNIAFIDAQNLHLWTTTEKWIVDFKRFRIYLEKKYNVDEAHIFLWFVDDNHQSLYRKIQKAGFILIFREHHTAMKWKKKWNVDVDIVYEIMHRLLEEDDFNKIVLVTGDWDYIKLVKYLIDKNRFEKILFPNKYHSSLYKQIETMYRNNLSLLDIRKKIEKITIKKEVSLGN